MLREVEQGNFDDALMGCTFIERMDPDFQLAAELKKRLEAGGESIEVADLKVAAGFTDLGLTSTEPTEAEATPPPSPPSEVATAEDPPVDRIETVESEVVDTDSDEADLMDRQEMLEAPPAPPQPDLEPDAPQEIPGASGAEVNGEDERIAALFSEGQGAFDAGEYQAAIDAWSRIFLIDLDHSEANQRIEEAKRLLAENERQAEELFHSGLEKIETGDAESAKADFAAALARQPHHIGAREHLDRLEAGKADESSDEHDISAEDLSAEPQVAIPPPAPIPATEAERAPDLSMDRPSTAGDAPTGPAASSRPNKRGKSSRFNLSPRFLVIAGVVLAVVTAGAWFIYNQREEVFPNASADGSAAPQGRRHLVDRAQRVYAREQIEQAINILEQVPATDPRHAEAQTLLESWRTERAARIEASGDGEELAAEVSLERDGFLASAQSAFDSGIFHRAVEHLDQAAALSPLESSEQGLRDAAQQRMEPYRDAYLAYQGGEYGVAIGELYRRLRQSPNDAAAQELLAASLFNDARRALASGNTDQAAVSLAEAAKLLPRDEEILQALRFAEHYADTAQDLRYRIFVRHLPLR